MYSVRPIKDQVHHRESRKAILSQASERQVEPRVIHVIEC